MTIGRAIMKLLSKRLATFCLYIILINQLQVCLFSGRAQANTWFELGVGANQASGSDLEPNIDLGYRALVAWGTHLSWMEQDDAIYIFGSLDYDQLIQKGALELGSPTLTRTLITPSLGLRYYHAVEKGLRFCLGLGLGKTYSQSSLEFVGLMQSNDYESSSGVFSFELGVQYKLTAGQLLGISYNHILLTSPESMTLSEKALQIGRQDSINAWQRLLLSWGFYI